MKIEFFPLFLHLNNMASFTIDNIEYNLTEFEVITFKYLERLRKDKASSMISLTPRTILSMKCLTVHPEKYLNLTPFERDFYDNVLGYKPFLYHPIYADLYFSEVKIGSTTEYSHCILLDAPVDKDIPTMARIDASKITYPPTKNMPPLDDIFECIAILLGKNSKYVVAAGGSALASFRNNNLYSNIDLFFFHLSNAKCVELIRTFYNKSGESKLFHGNLYMNDEMISMDLKVKKNIFTIRFMMQTYKSAFDILSSIDVDCAAILRNMKGQFYTIERGYYALLTGMNTFNSNNLSRDYEDRILMYASRGFDIFLPGIYYLLSRWSFDLSNKENRGCNKIIHALINFNPNKKLGDISPLIEKELNKISVTKKSKEIIDQTFELIDAYKNAKIYDDKIDLDCIPSEIRFNSNRIKKIKINSEFEWYPPILTRALEPRKSDELCMYSKPQWDEYFGNYTARSDKNWVCPKFQKENLSALSSFPSFLNDFLAVFKDHLVITAMSAVGLLTGKTYNNNIVCFHFIEQKNIKKSIVYLYTSFYKKCIERMDSEGKRFDAIIKDGFLNGIIFSIDNFLERLNNDTLTEEYVNIFPRFPVLDKAYLKGRDETYKNVINLVVEETKYFAVNAPSIRIYLRNYSSINDIKSIHKLDYRNVILKHSPDSIEGSFIMTETARYAVLNKVHYSSECTETDDNDFIDGFRIRVNYEKQIKGVYKFFKDLILDPIEKE